MNTIWSCLKYDVMRLTVLVNIFLLAVACSDGQMHTPPSAEAANPAKNAPVINSFTVQDAKTADAKPGKSAEIDEGSGVFLTWDVTGAKAIEITHSSGKRKVEGVKKLKDKAAVEALTADETFVLTAEGEEGVKVQDKVTVKVRKREITIQKFTAEPATISAGEETKLCWKVEGASAKAKATVVTDGKVTIYPSASVEKPEKAAEGTPTPPPATAAETAQKLLLAVIPATPHAPPADSYGKKPDADDKDKPKEGPKKDEAKEICVIAMPVQTTTYTLTVKDGEKTATKDTKVEVKEAETQFDISFEAQPALLANRGEVTLTWRVKPEDAAVTIEPAVTKDDKSIGEKKMNVTETTTFTLTAIKGSQKATRTVTVTVGRIAGGRVTAQLLTSSVFAGEPVRIAVSTDNPAAKISVRDPRGNEPEFKMDGNILMISNPVNGSYTVDADGSPANTVEVSVRSVAAQGSKATSGIAYVGFQRIVAGFNNDIIEVVKEGDKTKYRLNISATTMLGLDIHAASETKLDLADLAKLIGADFNGAQFNLFAPFLIQVIAADAANPTRLFAGTTGALLISTNAGWSWSVVDPLLIFDNAHQYTSKEESHAGCLGSVQKGIKYAKGNGALVGMSQVCDVYVNGKFAVIATDQGTYHIDNIDGRLDGKQKAANPWKAGLKSRVVNKLAAVQSGDSTLIIAAASDGIYIYEKGKEVTTWQQMDKAGLAGPVNAISVSGTTIYAGTDKGLFKSSGLDAASTFSEVKLSEEPVAVKALAVDAADPSTLYVGTNKGLKVGRGCDEHFTDVAASVGSVRNIATAAEGGRSAVVLTSDKGLFSSVGVATSPNACSAEKQPSTGTGILKQDAQQPLRPGGTATSGPETTTPNRPL